MSSLLMFYRGEGPDDRGRMIHDIWAWDHDTLEYTHDYIQWLFPLIERSGANPLAPTLDPETIAAFRRDPALQDRLRRSLNIMLAFYGFAGRVDAAARRRVWLAPGNHNFLRLTRMIKSLRTLGLEPEAQELFAALERVYKGGGAPMIGERTFMFWSDAARRSI